MITLTSRDPVTLWSDLSLGWLSGQEEWIDEIEGSKFFGYSNLFTCRWDFHAVEGEGASLTSQCAVKLPPFRPPLPTSASPTLVYQIASGQVHLLTKIGGARQAHVYVPVLELTRGILKLYLELNQLFKRIQLDPMTPVAIHTTSAYFTRINMPFLYSIFGRRAFLDLRLTEILNKDIDNLERILSKGYRNKAHQAVWRRVSNHLGLENVL